MSQRTMAGTHAILLCAPLASPLVKSGILAHEPTQAMVIGNANSMIETSAIDGFLGETLRAIRSGAAGGWPAATAGDWTSSEALTAIWARIDYHGIPVLLHEQADRLSGWPDKMRERIAEEARLIGLWEATHARAITKLLGALAAAGVDAVLMKGTALAYSIHDEPAARRRGDTDLLVRSAMLDQTRTVLAAGGWYRNDDPHGLTHQEGWLQDCAGHFTHAVDLHWEPSDRPVVRRVLSSEDFFANPHKLPRLCEHASRPDHALTLVHEAINQEWHRLHGYWAEEGRVKGGRRLIWSVDFDLLTRAMDEAGWARLTALCAEREVGPLVANALRGAAGDLGTPLPEDVLAKLDAQPLDPDLATYFKTTDNLGEFLLDLRTADSWRERIGMVRERGFPPRAHLLEKYPDHSGWPTALLQGRLLVETAGRVIRRVAAG